MRALIKLELTKALRNPWFAIALVVSCGIALASAAETSRRALEQMELKGHGSYEWIMLSAQGSYGNWLLTAEGIAKELFFLLVPLLAIVPYAWSLRSEMVDGSLGQLYARCRRSRYLKAKAFATFCTGFLIVALPLALNFLTLSCLVPAYTPEVFDNLALGISPRDAFSGLFFGHPLVYVLVNTLVDGLLCGTWATCVLAVSSLVDNRVVLLAGSYLFLIATSYVNAVIFGALGIIGFRFGLIGLLQGYAVGHMRDVYALFAVLALQALFSIVVLRARRDIDVL